MISFLDPVVWPWVLVLTAVIGLVIGSFLNVVIWRVPRGQSVITPPSACPKCGHILRPWENIPLVSWLWLGRKCSKCRARISARYPIVELVTAAALLGVVIQFGLTWAALGYGYLACVAIALVLIDLDVHRLPDKLVLPTYVVLVLALAAQAWSDGEFAPLWRSLTAGAILFAFYFIALLVYPGGMGFGDVKLAGVLGISLGWIGWGAFVVGAFGAFFLGGIYSGVLLATGRARKGTGIPFGPWMVVGAFIGIVVGEWLWNEYLALFT